MGRPLALILSLLLTSVLFACDDTPPVIIYPDADLPDTDPHDGDVEEDAATSGCRYDTQCEDGMDCTDDTCDPETGLCYHAPNHERCHDESLCNGYEFCDSQLGCQPGIPYPDCNDHDACTVDICLEPEEGRFLPTCEHQVMDRDRDGHVDNHCAADPIEDPEGPRGDDCDDLDPTRFPGAGELCFDGADNDCDRLVDDADDDCGLNNDTCESAIELVSGVRREGFTFGAIDDISLSCSWSGNIDVVYTFEIEDDSDVTVQVWGLSGYYPFVSIRQECGDATSELQCMSGGNPARFFQRAMEPGWYYVVVESWSEGIFQIELTVEDATEPPEGDDCTSAITLREGETSTVDLGEYSSDVPISCAAGLSYPDVVYAFVVPELSDVRYQISGAGFTPYAAVSMLCGDTTSELSCAGGNPMSRTLRLLSPGTYSMVVRGSGAGELEVSVDFLEPTSACDDAELVTESDSFEGDTTGEADDFQTNCGGSATSPDLPYRIEMETAFNLVAEVVDAPFDTVLHLRRVCDDQSSQIACDDDGGDGVMSRIEQSGLEAGTYYLIMDGYGSGSSGRYTLQIDLTPVE